MPTPATLALQQHLQTQFPQAFPAQAPTVKPLKIGILQDLFAACPTVSRTGLRQYLRAYCARPTYLRALLTHAIRVDLQGHPAGVTTAQDHGYAQQRLTEWRQRKQALVAARRQARRARARPRQACPLRQAQESLEPCRKAIDSPVAAAGPARAAPRNTAIVQVSVKRRKSAPPQSVVKGINNRAERS